VPRRGSSSSPKALPAAGAGGGVELTRDEKLADGERGETDRPAATVRTDDACGGFDAEPPSPGPDVAP
jgi:hypothetical protein